jgi:hypothetical protein
MLPLQRVHLSAPQYKSFSTPHRMAFRVEYRAKVIQEDFNSSVSAGRDSPVTPKKGV